jgi:hypothetical protein
MKKFIYFILAIPIVLECLRADLFTIDLPLIPLSLGKSIFVLIGLYSLLYFRPRFNLYFKIFLSVALLIFFSSLFSSDVFDSISRAAADLILVVASAGWINLWRRKTILRILNVFIIGGFIYWSYYIFYSVNVHGSYTYFFNNIDGAINHHTSAFIVCLSSAYIIIRFMYTNNRINISAIILVLITIYTLFLSESRSNLLVYFVFLLITFYHAKLFSLQSLVFYFVLILSLFYLTSNINESDILSTRFSLDYGDQLISNNIRLDIYKNFDNEILKNPFGKGALDSKILCSDGVYRNAHNNFISYAIRGGFIALFLMIFYIFIFFRKIFAFNFIDSQHVQLSSLRVLCLILFLTLFSIDLGGLLYVVLLSLFFTPILK